MATLVLLRYNNYYNRTVKREFMLDQYRQYQMGEDIQNVNFIPNDYIETEQVINWTSNETPDYLLVLDEYGIIQSRWFIISDTRLTAGQLRLQLRRDLIVDYYYSILNSPCFIEKATVNNINDPAIFNRENMSFNQIKQAEYPLKDRSNCAWIVGYIPSDSFETQQEITTTYTYDGLETSSVNTLNEYEYYDYTQYGGKAFSGPVNDVTYKINTWNTFNENLPASYNTTVSLDFTINLSNGGDYLGTSEGAVKGSYNYTGDRTYRYKSSDATLLFNTTTGIYQVQIDGNGLASAFTPEIMTNINSYLPTYISGSTSQQFNDFMAQNGKIIYNKADSQYYKVVISQVGDRITQEAGIDPIAGAGPAIYNILQSTGRFSGTPNETTFQVTGNKYIYKIQLEILETQISTTIPAKANRYHLNDSPYDMFCIPFPEDGQQLSIYENGQLRINNIDREASFRIATTLAATAGKGNVYDVQLLPYCPIKNIITADGSIDMAFNLHSTINAKVGSAGVAVSVLFWATSSQFTLQIPFSISQSQTIQEKKVKAETEFWRICSPNYSGVFEFNPEKNGGVEYFDVDCNYKPFNPYIHINPNFSGLYGQDWNDSRGLICGGDFSLPQITDAWADYQLQNKNYQQMFDREIQNMEVNNSVQRQKEIMGTVTGVVGGSIGGAMAGIKSGNPYAAIGGALMGGAGAAIGGAINYSLNEKLRDEALDYKRDMFGYSLQNIQALPQGLAKVSAYTANNKIFPFLEQYSCTDIEKNALRNKIKYNGMTIMRIGTISDFMRANEKTYIKGQLIRIENVAEDFHILNAIADEIYKGVYI